MCQISDSFASSMCLKCLAMSFNYDTNTIEKIDDTLCECGHEKKHIDYVTLCTNCGLHYGYDVNDYTPGMYNIRGKSVYNRKNYIETTLAKFNLTYHQKTDFISLCQR